MKLTLIATLVSAAALVQAADKCEKKYEVVASDSCESIALKLGFTKDNFEKWNQELDSSFDCDDLKEHDSICIKFPSSIEKRGENDQAQGAQSSDKTTSASKDQSQGTQNSDKTTSASKGQAQGSQGSDKINNSKDQTKDGQNSKKTNADKDDESPKKTADKKHKKTTKKPLHGKKTRTKKYVPKKHVPKKYTTKKHIVEEPKN